MAVPRKSLPPIDFAALQAIGARLRRAREDAGFSSTEVAKKRGKTAQWLLEIERGRSNISFYDIVHLARLYGCPVEMFVGEGAVHSAFRVPVTLGDWQALYRSDPNRAAAHYNLDQVFIKEGEGKR